MSYSFTVRAADKDEAGALVEAELGKVVEAQPVHQADRQIAQDTAEKLLDLLRDDPTQDVGVSVSGSCFSTDGGLIQVSLNVSANFAEKQAPAAE